MDTGDSTSPQTKPEDTAKPSSHHNPSSSSENPTRPGEAIMNSTDPSTAALRAWAADKQTQVPGSDGSFVMGTISGGAGAVSGGPMFLPRKEYIVEPPRHSMDHGRVELVKGEDEDEERDGKKERKRSVWDRLKRGKKEGEEKHGVND